MIIEVSGDTGRHARTALGIAELPRNVSVEVDAIFEVGQRRAPREDSSGARVLARQLDPKNRLAADNCEISPIPL